MPFGGSTIELVSVVKVGEPNGLGEYATTEVVTSLSGCRHRTMSLKEQNELEFDIGTTTWKSTIPLFEYTPEVRSKVLGLKHQDVIRVGGAEFEIVGGVRDHPDMEGNPFKATLITVKHVG